MQACARALKCCQEFYRGCGGETEFPEFFFVTFAGSAVDEMNN